MTIALSPSQIDDLCRFSEQRGLREALRECENRVHDNLAAALLERGGFVTLQLNAPGQVPRMRFVEGDQACSVDAGRVGPAMVIRTQTGDPHVVAARDTLIADLPLSVRTINVLKAEGIATVGELIQHKRSEIDKFINLRRKNMSELVEALSSLGIKLDE